MTENRNGNRAERLRRRALEIAREPGHARRREELIERTERSGAVSRELADTAYDVAREEGVEPALALALLEAGVGVVEVGEEPDAPVTTQSEPAWITPVQPDSAGLERRLRTTFRRLRSCLDREPEPDRALAAFAAEPDVADDAWAEFEA